MFPLSYNLSLMNDKKSRNEQKKMETKRELYLRVSTAKTLMDSIDDKNWSIHELANECALSEFHFLRQFKEAFGITPYQYQINKRLERSYNLLQEDNIPITEIAFITGFAHLYAFSKSFRNKYGFAPSRFRNDVQLRTNVIHNIGSTSFSSGAAA
jgi:AraC family transcriptional regulator